MYTKRQGRRTKPKRPRGTLRNLIELNGHNMKSFASSVRGNAVCEVCAVGIGTVLKNCFVGKRFRGHLRLLRQFWEIVGLFLFLVISGIIKTTPRRFVLDPALANWREPICAGFCFLYHFTYHFFDRRNSSGAKYTCCITTPVLI